MRQLQALAMVALLCSVAFGQARGRDWDPINSRRVVVDTIWLDSTETEYSQIAWTCAGGYYGLVLELNDTSAAGFASDSAVGRVEVMQAFNLNTKQVLLFPSRAHPDSVDSALLGSSHFYLSDSLDIRSMTGDTSYVFSRSTVPVKGPTGDTIDYAYTDDVGAAYSSAAKARIGALKYWSFAADFSPGVVVKLTGLTGNKYGGAGSRWIIRWYQQVGQPMVQR